MPRKTTTVSYVTHSPPPPGGAVDGAAHLASQMSERYHVRLSAGAGKQLAADAFVFGLSREEVQQRIVAPIAAGQELVVDDRSFDTATITVHIYALGDGSRRPGGPPEEDWLYIERVGEDVTHELLGSDVAQDPAAETREHVTEPARLSAARSRVMVVHGRDSAARDAIFTFLRAIGLQPIEWREAVSLTGSASPYIGQALEAAFRKAHAAVVLMTPDDEVTLRPAFVSDTDPEYERGPAGQARPNVLLEAGMALGHLPQRTVLVELGQLRPVSDILGRHAVRITPGSSWREDLAQRLTDAGCTVNLSGEEWASCGDFTDSPAYPGPRSTPDTSPPAAPGRPAQATSPAVARQKRKAPSAPTEPPAPRERSALARRLQKRLNEGVALEQRLGGPFGISALALVGPRTGVADIDAWQARTEADLSERPRDLALFLYDKPTGIRAMGMIALADPLRRRLENRLEQLDVVIRRL